jgi:hypothetical protein
VSACIGSSVIREPTPEAECRSTSLTCWVGHRSCVPTPQRPGDWPCLVPMPPSHLRMPRWGSAVILKRLGQLANGSAALVARTDERTRAKQDITKSAGQRTEVLGSWTSHPTPRNRWALAAPSSELLPSPTI